jgi:hypothetical protein
VGVTERVRVSAGECVRVRERESLKVRLRVRESA